MSDVLVDVEAERRASRLRQKGGVRRRLQEPTSRDALASLLEEAQKPLGAGLAQMPNAELAVHLQRYRNAIRPGHRFAARATGEAKNKARGRVHALFAKRAWPEYLTIATMPGMEWIFEKQLIGEREGFGVQSGRYNNGFPTKTRIIAIEEDEAIYRVSLKKAPGTDRVLLCEEVPYATATWRTRLIHRYHRCTAETFAVADQRILDAAWLDFTGPLTVKRIQAIAVLWTRISSVLVVTALNGRRPHGPQDLAAALEYGTLVDDYRYQDGAPMWQATFARVGTERGNRVRAILDRKNAPPAEPDE